MRQGTRGHAAGEAGAGLGTRPQTCARSEPQSLLQIGTALKGHDGVTGVVPRLLAE